MPKLDWLTSRPIAHRGYHDRAAGRIENTLGAVRAAIEHRFAIEVDLQLTKDLQVVVFHDDTVDRLMLGEGRVDSFTLAELQALAFRDGAEPVPTFSELLATVAGQVPLVLELKSNWDGDRRLEAAVTLILAAYSGPAVVMSFDPDSMAAMLKLLPRVPRGIVADRYTDLKDWGFLSSGRRFALRHLIDVPRVGAAFISYDLNGLPFFAPGLLRRLGWTVICWTVRSAAQSAKAAILTDQITFEGFDPDLR